MKLTCTELEAVFSALPSPYLIVKADNDYTIVASNNAYYSATGTGSENLLGKSLFKAFPDNPDEQDATGAENLRNSFKTVIATKSKHEMVVQKYDIPIRNTDAFEVRYWLPVNAPVFDKEGNVEFIIHTVQDVSAKIISEEKARRDIKSSNDRYAAVAKATNDVTWDWDIFSGLLLWNNAIEPVLGYPNTPNIETIDWWVSNLHPDDADRVHDGLEATLNSTEDKWSDEYRYRCADGQYKYIFDRGYIIRDEHGTPIKMIGSMLDIHFRRLLEEKLASSEFLLQEAGRLGKLGGWELDLVNNVHTWSKTVFDIYELPYDWQIDDVKSLSFFVEPYRQMLIDAVTKTYKTGEKWDLELLMVTAKNNTIWVRSRGEGVYNSHNELIKLRGVFMDIDQYKSNEVALNKSVEVMAQNNQQLKNFTYILAHNIRNHASNIAIITSLIDDATLDENNLELFDKIRTVSNGLNDTLDDLSEAIKIQTNVISAEDLNFYDVTKRVLNIIQSDIENSNAKINLKFDAENVKFPKIYLESVIMNLVTNAIKYKKPGNEPHINLCSYLDGNSNTILECRDNGMGIDLKLHGKKIFGLYKTFHDRKDAHGVGLYLNKIQMESQGGAILVDSTPEVGSIFKIIFNEKD